VGRKTYFWTLLSKNNTGMAALCGGLLVKIFKNEQENITFFVYSRRVTHDPHHTWHGYRGGPYHFRTLLTF